MSTDEVREARVRRRLRAQGIVVRKDRVREWNIDHHGGYMAIDAETNAVLGGNRFDLTLQDLEGWATTQESGVGPLR